MSGLPIRSIRTVIQSRRRALGDDPPVRLDPLARSRNMLY
jgi:hypothetical protein